MDIPLTKFTIFFNRINAIYNKNALYKYKHYLELESLAINNHTD